jgi:hypothetical protein
MRVLTRTRIILAFAIALATDAAQFLLGPLGWTFFDEVMDVAAMVLISWVIGFHPLLLPTFVVELFPVIDMAPTWTLCTTIVVALRRKAPASPQTGSVHASPPPAQPAEPVFSEAGVREPPPIREPKPVQGSDRSIG